VVKKAKPGTPLTRIRRAGDRRSFLRSDPARRHESALPDTDLHHALLAAPFIGSFLGLLVMRLPAGEPLVMGRSRCDHCGHALAAIDLLPLVSWLASGARCRFCGARLSCFYPGIELASLLVALWAGSLLSGWLLWAGCGLGWSLLALAAIDQRTMTLPDALTLPLLPAGLIVAWVIEAASLLDHAIGAAAGYGLFTLSRALHGKLRGREGLGLGDAKLMAAAGAWLGWQPLPSAVLLAALGGLSMIACRVAFTGAASAGERIAFGPCISLATWLVWLHGPIGLA